MPRATHLRMMSTEDLTTRSISPIEKNRLLSMKKEYQTTTRRSTRKLDLDLMDLSPYFHLRQDCAAAALGVAQITLKRVCHRLKFTWPYRKFKALARMEREARAQRREMTERAYTFHRMPFLLHNEFQAVESCRKE